MSESPVTYLCMMPASCPVCGSTDYDCQSGLFFCSGCGTQSQQFVVEEVEDDYQVHATSVAGKKFDGRKEGEDTGDKHDEAESRPWAVTEGLTILLKHQVAALIKIGAAPELKEVLFKLWASYLKKIGRGFGDTNQKAYSLHTHADFVPTFDQPKPVQVLLVNKQLKKKKPNCSPEEMQAMRQMFGGETFYDAEDDPFHQETQELDELDMYAEEREEWLKKLRSEQKLSEVTYSGIQKYCGLIIVLHVTLSLCYIALQYTNSFVTLFDILKAVKAGLIPYGNGPELFPADMKLVGKDWLYFCTPCTPSIRQFYRTTKSICSLLDLLPLPAPDMKLFTLRYLHDMNLPVGLHSLIRTLLRKREPRLNKPGCHYMPKSEVLAMAYVIIAVKLVFGLNDDTEEKATAFTQELLKVLGPDSGVKLFSWSDWVVENCRRQSMSSVLPNNWRDVRLSVESDHYCRAFSKYCSLRSGKYRDQSDVQQNNKDITSVFKQMCSQIDHLSNFSGNDQSRVAPTGECESMEDLFGTVESQDEFHHQTIVGEKHHPGEESFMNSSSDGSHNYTQHSVMHLTNWEDFIEIVVQSSSAKDTSNQSLLSSQPDDDAANQTAYLRFEAVSKCRVCAWKDYVFYKHCCSLNHCHKSYTYLLEAAQMFIGYDKEILHSFVQMLESVYFMKKEKMLVSEINRSRRWMCNYF